MPKVLGCKSKAIDGRVPTKLLNQRSSMILIQQNSKTVGPYSASEVRSMLIFQRVKRSDLFAWQGARQWLSYADFKPFLELLTDDETILYGERNLIVTQWRILSSTQMFPKDQIDNISVVIPEEIQKPKAVIWRTVFWWLAVLLFWTVVVPVAVMYINKKTPKEEGLGEVYGIRLTGAFGSEMIKDGMGLLSVDAPKRSELAEVCRILKEWKAGNLSAPALEATV